jgi:YD repeat-containing protein
MLTTQYRYDLANRLIGITYPSGLVASYTRDAQGRVSGVSLARGAWALPLVTQVGYQPFGPMSSIAFGHGQTLSKQWDRNYEPDAITSPAIDYAYTLDDVGNLTRIQSAIEGEQRENRRENRRGHPRFAAENRRGHPRFAARLAGAV